MLMVLSMVMSGIGVTIRSILPCTPSGVKSGIATKTLLPHMWMAVMEHLSLITLITHIPNVFMGACVIPLKLGGELVRCVSKMGQLHS